MTILHVGNMANLAYVICRHLKNNGLDVELFMEKNPPKSSDPLHFDPNLQGKYPPWIYFYDKSKSNWKLTIIKKMREKKYDLIHAYVELPIFAYFSQKAFIAHTQGSDFRELAQSNSLRGYLLRRAYNKAKCILFFQPDHKEIFRKLKLTNGIFLPPLWDTDFFQNNNSNRIDNENLKIFHPANLEWRLKGNDKLIKGFAQFTKKFPKSQLVIVDRGIDSQKTHDLISKLNIKSNIEFVKGPLDAYTLLQYYNSSDIVADQFILGALGSIGWESFSCKKPLLAYVNKKQYQEVYGESPPLANAFEPNEISEKLEFLCDSKNRVQLGDDAYRWITKYHSPKTFSKKIITIYDSILHKESNFELEKKLSKIN